MATTDEKLLETMANCDKGRVLDLCTMRVQVGRTYCRQQPSECPSDPEEFVPIFMLTFEQTDLGTTNQKSIKNAMDCGLMDNTGSLSL